MTDEPLLVLLAKVWTAQVIEIDNAVEAAGASLFGRRFRISLATWANGLRLVDEEGIPLGQLRRRARADTNVGGLERWGWIGVGEPGRSGERRPGYGSARGLRPQTVLRPTDAGRAVRRLWPATIDDVEASWRDRYGPDLVDALRSGTAPLAAGLPWAPPQVSPSDGFRTHLVDGDDGPEPADPPLVVLLGQALTALTLQVEAGAAVSAPLGATLLAALDGAPTARRHLPAATGLSTDAVAMALGFLVRRDLVAAGTGTGTFSLTPAGEAALADHRARAAQLTGHDQFQGALEGVLARPDALAAGLDPPEGCWRGERPYLTQTRRLLADPVAALPRHPLVLHRGGWPDGS